MLRPGLRFVAVRSIDNQALLMAHKVRKMLVQQRSQLLNGLRGHLVKVGVIAAQGTCHMRALGSLIHEGHSDIAVQAKADPVSTAR